MLLSIAYFPPISWFKALLCGNAVIEQHENYVKQTIRNRCQIATANGVQRLSVPVITALPDAQAALSSIPCDSVAGTPDASSTLSPKPKTTDILIAPHNNWQQKQWNAIATAYGESAFFDYYADDLHAFFNVEKDEKASTKNLFKHNVSIIRMLLQLLDVEHELRFTDSFVGEDYTQTIVKNKNTADSIPPYYQVFRQKTGFLPDLSILDLLFNLGPEATCYLLKR